MEIIGTILSPSTTCCGEHWDNSFSFNVILVGILKRFCPLLRHAGRENCATYFLWHASGKHWDDLSPSMISWWRTFGRSFVGHDGGEHVDNRYSFYDRLLERIGGGGSFLLLLHASGEHWGDIFSRDKLVRNTETIYSPSTTCWWRTLGWIFLILQHANGEHWFDPLSFYDMLL